MSDFFYLIPISLARRSRRTGSVSVDSRVLPARFGILLARKAYALARTAVIAQLLPDENELVRASGLLARIGTIAGGAGSALGGLLILLIGVQWLPAAGAGVYLVAGDLDGVARHVGRRSGGGSDRAGQNIRTSTSATVAVGVDSRSDWRIDVSPGAGDQARWRRRMDLRLCARVGGPRCLCGDDRCASSASSAVIGTDHRSDPARAGHCFGAGGARRRQREHHRDRTVDRDGRKRRGTCDGCPLRADPDAVRGLAISVAS